MQKHEEWLLISKKDLGSAKMLSTSDDFTSVALYHTQQAAEKALKGYLAFKQQPINKIHNLIALVKECKKLDESFSLLSDQAEALNPYITQNRYPDDYVEPTKEDVVEALENAAHIVEFVIKKINS